MASAVFAAATLLLTYPLGFFPASLGRFDNGDARLNAWAMSWVAHQITTNPLQLFEANIFYPLQHTLAFSEHLLVPGLIGLPLLKLSDDLVLTYNLVLLFSIFASGLGMYLLVVSLTGSRLAGLLAGLFFSFSPYRFNRLPHIQMQLYAFIPLILACLHRFLDTGARRWTWGAAAFLVLQALSGTYLAAITVVALAVALVTLVPGASRRRSELAWLFAALALAVALIAPFARPYLWVNRSLGIEWDLPGVQSMSATPRTYLQSSSHLYQRLSENLVGDENPRDFLFPGLTLLGLGSVGMGVLLLRKGGFARPRALASCYGLILVTGVVLSLGPLTPIYSVLYEHIIFFRGLRALTRFGLLPLLSLSVLSGFAVAWFLEAATRFKRRGWAAVALASFFVAESTAIPYHLTTFRDQPPEVYTWLASRGEPGPFVELPFRVIDTRYMFWARHHGFRPTLNGDSGFIPTSHQWMKIAFLRFPSPDAIAIAKRLGVRYVVVHMGALRQRALLRLLNSLERYRSDLLPVRDFGKDLVFEVLPDREPVRAPEELERLATTGGRPAALLDSDTESTWRAPREQADVEIHLGAKRRVSGLRFHYGRNPRVPIDKVELFVVDGAGEWELAWTSPPDWPALADLVEGLLQNPRDGTQTLHFAPVFSDRLRIRVRGFEASPELTEIEVLGPP